MAAVMDGEAKDTGRIAEQIAALKVDAATDLPRGPRPSRRREAGFDVRQPHAELHLGAVFQGLQPTVAPPAMHSRTPA